MKSASSLAVNRTTYVQLAAERVSTEPVCTRDRVGRL
jgi:hypothetical protein